MDLIKNELYQLIANGKTEAAIQTLLDTVTSDSESYLDLVLIARRYKGLKQHRIQKTIHDEVILLEENKIITSLLQIIDRLNSNDFEKEIGVKVTLRESKRTVFFVWIKRILKKIFG